MSDRESDNSDNPERSGRNPWTGRGRAYPQGRGTQPLGAIRGRGGATPYIPSSSTAATSQFATGSGFGGQLGTGAPIPMTEPVLSMPRVITPGETAASARPKVRSRVAAIETLADEREAMQPQRRLRDPTVPRRPALPTQWTRDLSAQGGPSSEPSRRFRPQPPPTPTSSQYKRFLNAEELAISGLPLETRGSGRRWVGGPVDQSLYEESGLEDVPLIPTSTAEDRQWQPTRGSASDKGSVWGRAAAYTYTQRFKNEEYERRPLHRLHTFRTKGFEERPKDSHRFVPTQELHRNIRDRIEHRDPQTLGHIQESDQYTRPVNQMSKPEKDWGLQFAGRRAFGTPSREQLRRSSSMPDLSELSLYNRRGSTPLTQDEMSSAFKRQYYTLGPSERKWFDESKKIQQNLTPEERNRLVWLPTPHQIQAADQRRVGQIRRERERLLTENRDGRRESVRSRAPNTTHGRTMKDILEEEEEE